MAKRVEQPQCSVYFNKMRCELPIGHFADHEGHFERKRYTWRNIKSPSIGSLVHYVSKLTGTHWPATITKVNDDSTVNLTALPGNDYHEPILRFFGVLNDPSGYNGGTWHWPEP